MTIKKENKSKIALFGSAFNPPSLGHASVIESLGHFDNIILLPSISHAWGKDMLDFDIRCKLIELFIQDIGCEKLSLSTIEKELLQPEKSVTTYDVLCLLEERYPYADISFIIGPDNLKNFHKFYKSDEILTRWSIVVCPERLPIRSTLIRENLIGMKSIANMTTPSVEKYLLENKLY